MLNQLENKKKMVLEFLSKGEKLMEDPNCPKFLEGHAKKLRETWEDTIQKAQSRKKALTGTATESYTEVILEDLVTFSDNFSSWELFEQQKVECHRLLDQADKDFSSIKKIFDLKNGPSDFKTRKEGSVSNRQSIEETFKSVFDCNACIQALLPVDKQKEMNQVIKYLIT